MDLSTHPGLDAPAAPEPARARLGRILELTCDGWWDWDLTTGQRYCSARGWQLLGHSHPPPADGRAGSRRLVHVEDRRLLLRAVLALVRGGDEDAAVEIRLRHRGGHWLPVLWRGCVERDAAGRARRLSGTLTDLREVRRRERERLELQANFEALFTNSLDGVVQARPDGTVLAVNPAACRMLGYAEAELMRVGARRVLDATDPRLATLDAERRRKGCVRGELRMLRASGEAFEVEISSSLYRDRDGQVLTSAVFRDITERRQAEARAHQLAHYDALTGLPNRRLLIERIGQALAAARRQGQIGALLFLDLDNFKQINDARGHSVGDRLLRLLAERMSSELRADDTVARLGGDEFVILAGSLGADVESAARHARAVADKLRELLARPCEIDGARHGSTGSIGITLFPKAQESVEDLLREADTAMYRAKAAGCNRIVFFEAGMQAEVEARLALEQDLRQAIAAGRIDVNLQPQFDAGGRETGGELLLRWDDPVRGKVSPTEFIPVAEDTGLILPLGELVLRRACEALVSLRAAGCRQRLSINVSPRQFRKDDFVGRVCEIVRDTGAPADGLVLEVTEGLLIEDWESTLVRMQELVALGMRFSIDDFGTGYSSLAYLKRLPLYELKIDRSFVADTPGDASDTAIVKSILSVAHHLGLHVVAEGVETRAQAEFLTANGCDGLQGFLFGRPQPLRDWLLGRMEPLALAAE